MILKHYKGLFVSEDQLSDLVKVTIVTFDWMERKSSFAWFQSAAEISYVTFLLFIIDDSETSSTASICCDVHFTEDSVILCNTGSFGNEMCPHPTFQD